MVFVPVLGSTLLTMWPVLTLTLLLQLTDEEQLFAERTTPCPAAEHELVVPAPRPEEPAADPEPVSDPQG